MKRHKEFIEAVRAALRAETKESLKKWLYEDNDKAVDFIEIEKNKHLKQDALVNPKWDFSMLGNIRQSSFDSNQFVNDFDLSGLVTNEPSFVSSEGYACIEVNSSIEEDILRNYGLVKPKPTINRSKKANIEVVISVNEDYGLAA